MNSLDDLDTAFFGSGSQKADDWESLDKRFFRPQASTTQPPKKEPVSFAGDTLRIGPLNTGIPLSEDVNRRLAQFGSGFADTYLGLKQLMGRAGPADATDKRKLDSELNTDFTGKALNFAGKVVPAFAIPQVAGAPVLSGLTAGALTGGLEPVGPGESRGANTAMGAMFGAALPGAGRLIGNTQGGQAAAEAARYGIPLSVADVSTNGMVKGLRSLTNDLPIIGAPGAALKTAQQRALNSAVGEQFGAKAPSLTPDVVDAAKKRMGAEFDRIWGQNQLTVDPQMFNQIAALRASVADMPSSQAQRLTTEINDFMSRIQPTQGGAVVPGETANKFQQWLRKQADGQQGYMRESFADLRTSIIGAFNRSINPADAAALTTNRQQYKAFKTVEKLLDKGVVGAAGRVEGDIPAALLPEAVRQSYRGLSSQTTPPPLADIANIAGRYLVDRVPQTGGSPRAALQNAGILGAGLESGAGGFAFPTTTALAGAGAMGINGLLNTPMRALYGQQRGLLGAPALSDAAEEALRLSILRSPLGLLGMFNPASAATE